MKKVKHFAAFVLIAMCVCVFTGCTKYYSENYLVPTVDSVCSGLKLEDSSGGEYAYSGSSSAVKNAFSSYKKALKENGFTVGDERSGNGYCYAEAYDKNDDCVAVFVADTTSSDCYFAIELY